MLVVWSRQQIIKQRYQTQEAKYFTTSGYSKYAKDILDAKIIEKGLVDKYDFQTRKKS